MKTIGVLGGLGPQATMDLEARIHAVSRTLISPLRSGRYPPMVVYYYRYPPFALSPDLQPEQPLRPHPKLLASAARFTGWADVLVIAANAPHLFLDDIRGAFGGPVLSMIDLAISEVIRRGWQSVGVLGLGEPQVYLGPLTALGYEVQTLAPAERIELDTEIFSLMEGRPATGNATRTALATVRSRGVDGIILGCTEIPLLLGECADMPDLVNPAQLLAEAAVRYAIG